MEFNIRDFDTLRNILYRKSGIYLDNDKFLFLKRRVSQRIDDLGLSSFSDYLKFLKDLDKKGVELQKLINLITINETYFFREFGQLRVFGEICLPEVARQNDKVKVLSAGCSTGEEVYTLSIICREMLPKGYDYEIVGADIDKIALEKARNGLYDNRSVKDVPDLYLDRYFERTENGYLVKDMLRKNVKFVFLNLKNSDNLLNLGRDFDFIFCRNVLMYFPMEDRRRIVESFYFMLKPEGFIFLGASEFLSRK